MSTPAQCSQLPSIAYLGMPGVSCEKLVEDAEPGPIVDRVPCKNDQIWPRLIGRLNDFLLVPAKSLNVKVGDLHQRQRCIAQRANRDSMVRHLEALRFDEHASQVRGRQRHLLRTTGGNFSCS